MSKRCVRYSSAHKSVQSKQNLSQIQTSALLFLFPLNSYMALMNACKTTQQVLWFIPMCLICELKDFWGGSQKREDGCLVVASLGHSRL